MCISTYKMEMAKSKIKKKMYDSVIHIHTVGCLVIEKKIEFSLIWNGIMGMRYVVAERKKNSLSIKKIVNFSSKFLNFLWKIENVQNYLVFFFRSQYTLIQTEKNRQSYRGQVALAEFFFSFIQTHIHAHLWTVICDRVNFDFRIGDSPENLVYITLSCCCYLLMLNNKKSICYVCYLSCVELHQFIFVLFSFVCVLIKNGFKFILLFFFWKNVLVKIKWSMK